ncbi:hypothetical protein RJ639_047811 [Escallonia herrerae]|uniref:cysteine--tRNA ligase n=1 Tax=Escallonia herrerae TaxID=1293975 RepID=A0AA88W5Z8_9ASTE|nr:hypothetical protein RJ639_047811 [Escallonia herrerae]
MAALLLKCYKPLILLCPTSTTAIHVPTHKIFVSNNKNFLTRSRFYCSTQLGQSQSCTSTNGSGGPENEMPTHQQLFLHNTMSKKKELFRPKTPGQVGMYVYLRHLGYEVKYVRNFTDVDDKIIVRANELGEDPIDLSRHYCEEFHRDMAYLHCLPPSVEPRVSDHMPQIIDMIKQILNNGHGYQIEGDVYFSVDKFPQYGQLSGRKLEDNRAGERVAVDSRKKNPADFALWKEGMELSIARLEALSLQLIYEQGGLKALELPEARSERLTPAKLGLVPRLKSPQTSFRKVHASLNSPCLGLSEALPYRLNCLAPEASVLDTFDNNDNYVCHLLTSLSWSILQSAKEGEPFWESPWGPGRPGWHIECSAMSAAYLGYSFDIHGGGMDLIFPHHENEIAQSCAACDKSNISCWIHNGFVTIDSEKMSKSLGNFFTIRQVIDLFHPLALRLFLVGTHYRSPINYSDAQLESSSDRIFYIYQTLYDCEDALSQNDEASRSDNVPQETVDCIEKFNDIFCTSMSDDLHTPVVLAAMSEPLKTANDLLHTCKGKKQKLRIDSLAALEKAIKNALITLGFMPTSYSEVLHELREKALKRAKLTESEVLHRIDERNTARRNKEFGKSDAIRKNLAAVGISLMDSPEGTTWRPAIPLALQAVHAEAP